MLTKTRALLASYQTADYCRIQVYQHITCLRTLITYIVRFCTLSILAVIADYIHSYFQNDHITRTYIHRLGYARFAVWSDVPLRGFEWVGVREPEALGAHASPTASEVLAGSVQPRAPSFELSRPTAGGVDPMLHPHTPMRDVWPASPVRTSHHCSVCAEFSRNCLRENGGCWGEVFARYSSPAGVANVRA